MATSSSSAQLERVHYVQRSLRQVQLRWCVKRQDELGGRLTVHMSIIRRHDDDEREWLCQRAYRENGDDFYDLPEHLLLPGHRYEINVKLTRQDDCGKEDDHFNALMSVLDTRTISFRLGYTANEMKQIQGKAAEFVYKNGQVIPCEFFYRDKTDEYYDYCRHRCDGFLPLHLKNENGDPASPVSGCIDGVFLGVNVDLKTGKLPAKSPFGYCRFYVPIERLYGPDFNMYFADFYCHTGAKSHHLSLILTKANSPADNFCRFRLPKLNRMNNPFLYQDPITGCMMHTTGAWIDIFYTEMIHVSSGWFEMVNWVYNNTMKIGKPKNASCRVCNI